MLVAAQKIDLVLVILSLVHPGSMEKAKAASFCAELSSEREGQTETEVLCERQPASASVSFSYLPFFIALPF